MPFGMCQALFWPLQLSSHQVQPQIHTSWLDFPRTVAVEDVVGERGAAFQPLWQALQNRQVGHQGRVLECEALVRTASSFTQALDRLTHPEKSFPIEPRAFKVL